MKITRVESILIKVPYRHGGPAPNGDAHSWATMDTLLVKVTTDDGLSGWGEGFGFGGCATTRVAIETLVAPLCIGQDAADIAGVIGVLERRLHNFGRTGPVMYAISSVDIALWDLAGKRAGVPLYKMLGAAGEVERVPAYASLLRYTDPKLVARNCAEAVARGYAHVKLHEIGVAQIQAARDAVGPDVELMVDTNCPWSFTEAMGEIGKWTPYDLKWIEEPIWPPEDHVNLARLHEATGIPLAAGENAGSLSDLQSLHDVGKVKYLQPSVTKIGGVSAMQRIIETLRSPSAVIAPHSAYFGPGLIATIHLCAALPEGTACERFYCDLEASPFGEQVNAVDGQMRVPQGAGLGLQIDEAVIARYRVG